MARAGLDAASVVAAAARVADRDGLDQLTLAQLATELGIRAPSLYAHVGGLGDLRDRIVTLGVVELTGTLAAAATGRAGREALYAVARAYRAYAHERPGVYAAMQRAPDGSDDEREVAAARLIEVLTAVLRGYGLEGDDAIHAVRLLRSALHGFVSLEGAGGFALPLGLEETYERLIEMVDRGLRADGSRPVSGGPASRGRDDDPRREVVVGRVREIWRYPVKSMAGESLSRAEVSWQGLAGDRRWAFIRPGIPRSGFSWLTIRQQPRMWHYHPAFAEPGDPDRSLTIVHTPDGRELDIADPRLAAELGDDLRVIKQDRGIFDSLPLSLITTRSIADLEGLLELDPGELGPRRFRPNLLVEPDGVEPFPEDDWLGAVLRIGSMRMRVDRQDPRCVVITVDPDRLDSDPAVLRAVVKQRRTFLGVYGSTVTPGTVSVGDEVVWERLP